jgi:hypothetical protein
MPAKDAAPTKEPQAKLPLQFQPLFVYFPLGRRLKNSTWPRRLLASASVR